MAVISRGFHGRARDKGHELPPGQYETTGFPVLSAGPTPTVSLDDWEFTVRTETGVRYRWNWQELMALPSETPTVDIHCVTKWSKFGTRWQGVSLDVLLANVDSGAEYALVRSYGDYTTNIPVEDLLDGKAWIVHRYDDEELPRGTRRPRPPARPAPVLLEVREVGARHPAAGRGGTRLLGDRRLPRLR